jgi:hypothetical protein
VKYKLDENLGKQAIGILMEAGLNISSVAAQKLCGSSDKQLIEICRS